MLCKRCWCARKPRVVGGHPGSMIICPVAASLGLLGPLSDPSYSLLEHLLVPSEVTSWAAPYGLLFVGPPCLAFFGRGHSRAYLTENPWKSCRGAFCVAFFRTLWDAWLGIFWCSFWTSFGSPLVDPSTGALVWPLSFE